jgi:SAM-dependent methyltransferase
MKAENIPLVSTLMQTEITNKVSIDLIHEENNSILTSFIEGALFVVDSENKLIGILTDGDVRKGLSKNNSNIENLITFSPKTISKYDNTSVALRILRENEINILPVVENNNTLIGFITLHMLIKCFSPERLYMTGEENEMNDNEERHLARYRFAQNFIKSSSVTLDCACGSGYGSKILSASSKKVTGIDLSEEAISFAKKNNSLKNTEYIQKNLDNLDFQNSSFDSIVSIETLEHVPYEVFLRFLDNINHWLKDGGVFIGSSPMLRFKEGKPYITNPYHINEMPKEQFIKSIKDKLPNFEIHFYYQDQDIFLPLCEEDTGFCIVVARKKRS